MTNEQDKTTTYVKYPVEINRNEIRNNTIDECIEELKSTRSISLSNYLLLVNDSINVLEKLKR